MENNVDGVLRPKQEINKQEKEIKKSEEKDIIEHIENNTLPDWIKVNDDDEYKVKTKDGIFVFEDPEYSKIEIARKRLTKKDGSFDQNNFELEMICESCKNWKDKSGVESNTLERFNLLRFKTSTIMRLRFVIAKVLGFEDFY